MVRQVFSDTIAHIADTVLHGKGSGSASSQNMRYFWHMLKNEMSKIQLAARLIRETDSAEISGELDIIEHSAAYVEEFALRNNAATGSIRIEKERVDICALIRETVRERTCGWRGTVKYYLDETDSELECDPFHIRGVLHNLVSNALDAMGEDGVLKVAYRTAGNQTAWIVVSDTGCGIFEKDLRHIFDEYYTGHPDVSHFGLGLPYCRTVLRRHGGSIRVKSSTEPENHGTEVILCLPRKVRKGKETDGENHKSTGCRG